MGYRAPGQVGPPRADLDDVSSDISDLHLSSRAEVELAGDWDGELLQPEDLELPLANQSSAGQTFPETIHQPAAAAFAPRLFEKYMLPLPPQSPRRAPERSAPPPVPPSAEPPGEEPSFTERPSLLPSMSPQSPSSPPPQPADPDRPHLVLRDILTAVQSARPTDIHVVVERLASVLLPSYTT